MTLAADGLFNAKPYKYVYSDATARAAATGFTTAEVGVLALQLDDLSLWVLADDSPVTWSAAAGTAGMTNPMTTADDIIKGGASGTPTRVAKGGNNTVWGVDGSGVLGYKADPTGAGASITVDEVLLSGDQTDVRFPASGSLPTGYAAWRLIVAGRGSAAANEAGVGLQFNGDTGGSNYEDQLFAGIQATTFSNHEANSQLGIGAIPANSAGSGRAGMVEATIGDPENTTFHKAVVSRASDLYSTGNRANWMFAGIWLSTSAITSIVVKGAFKAGTRLTLIGIPKLGSPRTS